MANPRNNAGKVNVKKGSGQPTPPPETFTVVGDTPANKRPSQMPAGDKNAALASTKPGQFPQGTKRPGTQSSQQPSTQTPADKSARP